MKRPVNYYLNIVGQAISVVLALGAYTFLGLSIYYWLGGYMFNSISCSFITLVLLKFLGR